MRIDLLRCPSPFLINEKVFPPLGLLAVATALDEQGCRVMVRDDLVPGAQWYGVGPTTPEYPHAKKLLQEIKAEQPMAKVMIGGPHAAFRAEACLKDGFDLAVLGDGEGLKLEHLRKGIVRLPELPLDSYPLINRRLLCHGVGEYQYLLHGIEATTMVTARGCPYRCAFCAKTSPNVRFRSAEHVNYEIEMLHSEFGYRALMFFDDIFILWKDRARSICDCLERLGMKWRCFVRADLVLKRGKDFLKRMVDAGCVEVGMGVESGSDQILANIQKGETVAEITKAMWWLNECGIAVKAFFIIGLPGETEETVEETRRLANGLPFVDADFTLFQPYAGSPVCANRHRYDVDWGTLWDEESHYKGRLGRYKSNVWTSSLTARQLEAARDDLERAWKG